MPDTTSQSQKATSNEPVGAPVPCPKQRARIEVVLWDEAGEPLAEVAVELRRSTREVLSSITRRDGSVCFEGLEAEAEFGLTLPEVCGDAWTLESKKDLPPAAASKEAAWAAPSSAAKRPTQHKVEQGECGSSLAFRFGLLPQALWDANSKLHKERKSLHVLHPGDGLTIPALEAREERVRAGLRCALRRKGLPEVFQIRYLDPHHEPRADVAYLVTFTTEAGEALPARTGRTSAEGLIKEAIPPHTASAEVVLGKGPEQEVHRYELGHLDPIGTVSGVQARLNTLGYPCGPADGELGDLTFEALCDFQSYNQLEPTGEIDQETRDALVKRHGS
jgi:hypothetical protein